MLEIKLDDGNLIRCEAHGDMATLMGDIVLAVAVVGESIGEPDLFWRSFKWFVNNGESKRLANMAAKDALKRCEIIRIDEEGLK